MFSSKLASLANDNVEKEKTIIEENNLFKTPEEKQAIIERDMEKALEENQFLVFYQSKHSTENGKIVGAEALVRWEHKTLGFLTPGEFIPIFEKNGFISKLDAYVREKVCIDIKRWKARGLKLVPISVNLSRIDFNDRGLVQSIFELVDRYGIDHDLISFEITETAYADNENLIVCAANLLRSNGFKISLDDFGCGFSSFTMLNNVPLDALKLDKEMLNSIEGDKQRFLLDVCMQISDKFNLETEAEGVETREQFDILRTLDCDAVQGFYFARPLPVEMLENKLALES